MQVKLMNSLINFVPRYQGNSKTSMSGNDFIFDSVQMMYSECHKVTFRRGDSYIHFPEGMKKKKEQ